MYWDDITYVSSIGLKLNVNKDFDPVTATWDVDNLTGFIKNLVITSHRFNYVDGYENNKYYTRTTKVLRATVGAETSANT